MDKRRFLCYTCITMFFSYYIGAEKVQGHRIIHRGVPRLNSYEITSGCAGWKIF